MTTASEELAKRIDAIGRGKVNISFIYPPIPMRQFDWCATFDNDEPDDDGHMMAGYGRTQIEAHTAGANPMSVLSDEKTEMGNIILDGPNLAAINNAFLKLQVLVAASRMHSEAGERVKQELILGLSDLRHDCGIDAVLEKVHTG